ncbi:MAG: hypothetical protein AB8G17_02145 [Gammaproteobacteria bacterium]
MRSKCLALLLTVLMLAGCGGSSSLRPDLVRLYANQTGTALPPPLIVIHGVLGGRLYDPATEQEVWPGKLRRVVFDDYAYLKLDINAETLDPEPSTFEVSGITDRAAGRDFYAQILTTLENVGGYVRTKPGTAVTGKPTKRFYIYAYDWRQDNVDSARGLDALVEQIRRDYNDPGLRVDVVAHSMGGLITRYFIRYGTTDVLNGNDFPVVYEGDKKIRRAILLGTPNLGSIAGLDTLLNGHRIGLGRLAPEIIATFPSAYQVLPHALRDWLVGSDGKPVEWYQDPDGKVQQVDQFDIDWWRDHQLSIFDPAVRERIIKQAPDREQGEAHFERMTRYFETHLERGRRFSWSLTVPAPHIEQRYAVFGGSCHLTHARGLMEEIDERFRIRFDPRDVVSRQLGVDYTRLLLEPGDGTVTKASLLARQILDPTVRRHRYSFFPLDYSIFLCEDHTRLTENPSFQDNLLNALLSADT